MRFEGIESVSPQRGRASHALHCLIPRSNRVSDLNCPQRGRRALPARHCLIPRKIIFDDFTAPRGGGLP